MTDGFLLGAISFLGLFYELVFIRWLPGNITSLAYFVNIVLISAFFGLGLGYLISPKRDLFPWFPPLLLTVTGILVLLRNTGIFVPENAGEWIWSSYVSNILVAPGMKVGIVPALLVIFVLNAIVFVPLGQKTRSFLERFPPLQGYTINVVGSIAGIAAFSLFSLLYRHSLMPLSWFVLGGLISLLFMKTVRQFLVAILATVLLWGLIGWSSHGEVWSPYYVIQLQTERDKSFEVFVNKFFHQRAVNFTYDLGARVKYAMPYDIMAPRNVLILGAGSGNDAATALMRGVPDIDVVEIDPEILSLGQTRHPQKPYRDTRVRRFADDARSFLKKTTKRYDMIILGTLDSHALLSGMSTIRLDNFVYTRESFEDIQKRLTPDGIVVLIYSVPEEWLGRKMIRMATGAFPNDIYLAKIADDYLFNLMIVAGPGAKTLIEKPGYESRFVKMPSDQSPAREIPTDDWPYLYLRGRQVPSYYLKAIALLLAITVITVVLAAPRKSRKIDFRFLFMGCAFLLLETKSVTTLSLLFGSTWLVNAFVFLAILVMILLANWTVSSGRLRDVRLIGILLFASLALNYFVPLEFFLKQPSAVKWLVPSFFIALPIYFAGILFAKFLSTASDIRMIYGSNLIGCVLGGFIEYSSMIVGLKFLFLLAALFYVLALLTGRRRSAPATP